MNRPLLCLEFISIAQGYQALAEVLQNETSTNETSVIEVIEAAPIAGDRFLVLADADEETALRALATKFRAWSGCRKAIYVAKPHAQMKEAIYGLLAQPLQNYLGVLETDGLASTIETVQEISSIVPMQLIEIQAGRGFSGQSLAFWTGDSCVEINHKISSLRHREGVRGIELIEKITARFRRYFNVDGADAP